MTDIMSSLFQCETRTRLLKLLLIEERVASVSELARRAGLSPRAIGKEVDHLAELDLVQVKMVGGARIVSANHQNPACPLLAQLLKMGSSKTAEPLEQVREAMAAYGAPLMGVERKAHFSLEVTVVKALQAARRDGTLLRVLPVVVAKNRQQMNWRDLTELVREYGLKREFGLLLELTGRLLNDEQLKDRSQTFRDGRWTRKRYFPEPRSRYERKAAEASSPPVAQAWGFHMNMSEDSFKSLLAKTCPELTLA